jgi:antitoxin FitA
MGQLIVRSLADDVVLALKQRAARHGRSTEAEHRAILRDALAADLAHPSFKDFLVSMPDVGEDSDFAPPRDTAREVSL